MLFFHDFLSTLSLSKKIQILCDLCGNHTCYMTSQQLYMLLYLFIVNKFHSHILLHFLAATLVMTYYIASLALLEFIRYDFQECQWSCVMIKKEPHHCDDILCSCHNTIPPWSCMPCLFQDFHDAVDGCEPRFRAAFSHIVEVAAQGSQGRQRKPSGKNGHKLVSLVE